MIYHFDELNSTQTYLRDNLTLYKNYDVITAKHQSSGLGRSGS